LSLNPKIAINVGPRSGRFGPRLSQLFLMVGQPAGESLPVG